MKKNFVNDVYVEGYLYDFKLEKKVSGPKSKNPGTEFISGEIGIATDEECLNVVKMHYSYITEKTSKGKDDPRYKILTNIMNGDIKNVMEHGKDEAQKISLNSCKIDVNEFYSNSNNELVSMMRNEGSFFINLVNEINADEKARNQFKVDFLIESIVRKEEDEENNIPEKMILSGYIFEDYKKEIKPARFTVLNTRAMDYFDDLEISKANKVFTKVWGRMVSETIVNTIVEESAFGENSVREVKKTNREYVITGAAKEPYIWDDKSSLTVEELKKMISDREVYLATLKSRNENSSNNATTSGNSVNEADAATDVAEGGFVF